MIPTADPFDQQAARDVVRTCFSWSIAKIRFAAFVLLGAATPAAIGFAISSTFVKWLCLIWLLGVALLMRLLSQRATTEAVVVTIDQRGILDRRLMSKRIDWQEIEAICPVNIDRSSVVDLKLRWPEITLAETWWPVRIGAACQRGYNVPAVTISMLLLEGQVSELLYAVAQYRPDLLHHTNRRVYNPAVPDGRLSSDRPLQPPD
jgi:hypothetical protein